MSGPDPSSASSPTRPSASRASQDGRRGAAERERRWLEHHLPHRTAAERRARQIREDRRRLRVVDMIMTQVFGRPFRPRRRPPLPQFLALLLEAIESIGELVHSPDEGVRLRAAIWGLFASSSLSGVPLIGSLSPRDYWWRTRGHGSGRPAGPSAS